MTNEKKLIKAAKSATPEQFINSSIIRFGRLNNYIEEKLLVDHFTVNENLMIIEGLKKYIENNLPSLQKKEKIKIIDNGPAIGAFTTMLVLQALNEYGLMNKAQVHLVDVSGNVIEQTKLCNFVYPKSVLDPKLKSEIFKKLRQSRGEICSAEELPYKKNYFTISLACSLFHHLHDDVKPKVAAEIIRTLEPNGFVGVAEEWFKKYEEFAKTHNNDDIPLAYESIISYKKLSKMFPELEIFYTNKKKNSYSFCGTKIAK